MMCNLRFFCRLAACAALALATAASSNVDAATLLVDFGRGNGGDGNPTTSPDGNDAYWNNFDADQFIVSNIDVPAGSMISDLVTTDNSATTIDIRTNNLIRANGRNNGGLFAPNGPSAALLGDFAVETATEDYFFTETGGNPALNNHSDLQILGLNPNATYDFRFFGTRATNSTRRTRYTLTGGNGVLSVDLQTSGSSIGANGVYNGNDDEIVSISGVTPDGNNEINLGLDVIEGGFAYLGILEITETINVPEPTAALLTVVGGFSLVTGARRRR